MNIDRRTFVKLAGAGAIGVTFAPLGSGCERHLVEPVNGDGTLPKIPFLTPVSDFFIQNGGEGDITGWKMPDISRDGWQLRITDVFGGELASFTFADLMAARDAGLEITLLKTMKCVLESPVRTTQTGFTGNATWTGVPVKHFLDLAGVDYQSVKRFIFSGADSFRNNLKVDRIAGANTLPPAILAYRMNGGDLTREHGAPVRLVVQETYGYKNIKWLTKIDVSSVDRVVGNYQSRGYADDATIRVASRATSLLERITVPSGNILVSGFAISGAAGIMRMEISINGGPFNPVGLQSLQDLRAELPGGAPILQIDDPKYAYPYPGVWAKWNYTWANVSPGEYTVTIRATDAAGNVQPATDTDITDGLTGTPTYHVTVV